MVEIPSQGVGRGRTGDGEGSLDILGLGCGSWELKGAARNRNFMWQPEGNHLDAVREGTGGAGWVFHGVVPTSCTETRTFQLFPQHWAELRANPPQQPWPRPKGRWQLWHGGPTHDVGVREPQQDPDLRPHDLFVDLGSRACVTCAARPGSGSPPRRDTPPLLPAHSHVCPRAHPHPKSQLLRPCGTPRLWERCPVPAPRPPRYRGVGRRGTSSPPPQLPDAPPSHPRPSPAPLTVFFRILAA